jgi:hypothetical protein
MLWTKAFWKGAGERAIKSFAGGLASAFGGAAVGLFDIAWFDALSFALGAALFSVLIAVGNADFTAGTPAPATDPAGTTPARVAADPGGIRAQMRR